MNDINLEDLKDIACPNCRQLVFYRVTRLKYLPGILVGQPGAGIAGIDLFECYGCLKRYTEQELLQHHMKILTPGLKSEETGKA